MISKRATYFWVGISCVLLGLLLLNGCNSAPYDVYRSVCQITASSSQGSGAMIGLNDGYALITTARHLAVNVGTQATIRWPNAEGQITVGKVVAVVPGKQFNTDMALIVCLAPQNVRPLAVGRFSPTAGPWRSVGFRNDKMWESVAFEAREDNGQITLDQPFVQGMSGGPVLDCDDNVVGIVVGSDLETFGLASDGEYLAALIKAHSK